MNRPDTPIQSPDKMEIPPLPPSPRPDILLEQYKLALEMAVHMSNTRQDTNNFYIALVSAFGGLYTLLDKAPPSYTRSTWEDTLPILAVFWCIAWWFALQSYRRINLAKWDVIYRLESQLQGDIPFKLEEIKLKQIVQSKRGERQQLPSAGTFAFTKIERVIPILVGLIFLLLAARPVLELLGAH